MSDNTYDSPCLLLVSTFFFLLDKLDFLPLEQVQTSHDRPGGPTLLEYVWTHDWLNHRIRIVKVQPWCDVFTQWFMFSQVLLTNVTFRNVSHPYRSWSWVMSSQVHACITCRFIVYIQLLSQRFQESASKAKYPWMIIHLTDSPAHICFYCSFLQQQCWRFSLDMNNVANMTKTVVSSLCHITCFQGRN